MTLNLTPFAMKFAGDSPVCPGALKELLHYYTTSMHYADCAGGRSFMPELMEAGLMAVEHNPDGRQQGYVVTEKGRVYIEALLALPLPVQVWTIPGRDE